MARYSEASARGEGGRKPKIFVLDTNIILHDHKAIRKFQDNDLVQIAVARILWSGMSS